VLSRNTETPRPRTITYMNMLGVSVPRCSVLARVVLIAALAGTLWLLPVVAFGQQRPLVTEDPETVGAGRVLLEGGVDYMWDADFPVSGLEGDLLRAPLLGVSIGVSSIAEVQIDGGLYNHLRITHRSPSAPLAAMVDVAGDTTSSVEDLVVATKVRLLSEGASRPGFGIRFATRLPNASNESGLGLDTTDFYASLLAAKTTRSVRLVGNIGVGILGDPTRGDRQNDVLTYGVSFARAITQRAEVVGEVNGRADTRNGEPPPGTESRSTLRFGGRYTTGPIRADAAILIGVTSHDPRFGVTAGFTYVFDAFRVP
jgi:outer membrane putative beta-barrel porin/alpha-amylase